MPDNANILESLTRRARTEDITVLPLAERCRLIKEFSRALLTAAVGPERAANELDPEYLDEKKFEDETRVLKRLAGTLSYSTAFHAWTKYKKKELAEVLSKRHPPSKLRRDWENADEVGRRALVIKVVNTQCAVFSEDLGAVIHSPNLKWLSNARKRVLGTVEFFDYESLKSGRLPALMVRRETFAEAKPDTAVKIAQHEATHYTLYVLAMQAFNGALRPRHPLHGDAAMELEKIKAGATISSRIYSAYRAQPEEKLCFGLEEQVHKAWLAPV